MIEHWFATPIYYDYVQNLDQIQDDFDQVCSILKSSERFKGPDDWNTQLISDGIFTNNNGIAMKVLIDGGSKPPTCSVEESAITITTYKTICNQTGEEIK